MCFGMFLVAALTLSGPVAGHVGQPPRESGLKVELHTNAFVDLYFAARAGDSFVPEFLRKAATAVSADGRGLLSGASIDARAVEADSLAKFQESIEDLANEAAPGSTLGSPRKMAKAVSDGFEAWPKSDMESLAAKRKVSLDRAKSFLEKAFQDHPGMVSDAATALGYDLKDAAVPVFLVQNAPAPGAITYRSQDGKGICLVSTADVEGSLLVERTLHEVLHALDLASQGKTSRLGAIRDALSKAGKANSRAGAEAVHAVIFAQAAATVKRLIDPNHKAYGEAKGVYGRMSPAGRAAIDAWNDLLAGRLTLEATVQKIVEACP